MEIDEGDWTPAAGVVINCGIWLTVVHHEVGEEADRRAAVPRQHVHGPIGGLPIKVTVSVVVRMLVPQRDVASSVPQARRRPLARKPALLLVLPARRGGRGRLPAAAAADRQEAPHDADNNPLYLSLSLRD